MGKERILKRAFSFMLALFMALTAVIGTPLTSQAAELPEYEIYPNPHSIQYSNDEYIIQNDVNIVYESGIDKETKARLEETLALKGDIVSNVSDQIDENKTNILVGIAGSGEYVDTYVNDHISVAKGDLFDEIDSYVLDNKDNVITILGKDTDASFYGITTLYHVFKQMESYTIRSFHIEDWADISSRGFIEGYYGNPWSTSDRCNLMEWSGYYKLNTYVYAPKNDPKHNQNWRELYTDEELESMIIPLSEAGQKSKCRFVYALHPFMYNAIRFSSEEAYQEDLKIVQAKFEQVIEKGGVRQIAILADDAGHVGNDNYVRFLKDMSAWLKDMKEEYPDLVDKLPFCTQEYMYNGQSYYSQFPENVQIIMTGGKIWGEVSNNFTSSFTQTTGRGPFMWINWPCTDNSKKHLIMGGYTTFLHPGVDPDNIQGIVLNPMQQSEPSKVAIFGNACYSWNIWQDQATADQAWEDSFKYVDHNSALDTDASDALRELSKHMINQNMDSRVTKLEESVELAPKLDAFKEKLSSDSVSKADVEELLAEFETLQTASSVFQTSAGDPNLKEQIKYWLECWDDTTAAAIAYLKGVEAILDGNAASIYQYTNEGKSAFNASKTHALWYVDHYEYAEVGVQHIVPFLNTLDSYLSRKVQEISDPSVITNTYISNSFTNPSSGSTDNIFDGNDGTSVQFKEPNYPKAGDYFGVKFNRAIDVENIRVLMGGGKNHLQYSKLQYLPEGADEESGWVDVNGTEYTLGNGATDAIVEKDLNLKDVVAVRLIATKNNSFDSWVSIASFDINKQQETQDELKVQKVTVENAVTVTNTDTSKVVDGDALSELWLKDSGGDFIGANAAVVLDLGENKEIGSVYVAQDAARANGGDILSQAVVEVKEDGSDEWKAFASLAAENEQTVAGNAVARYVRVRNTAQKAVWWRLGEITVLPPSGYTPFTMTASAVDTQIGVNSVVNDNNKNNKYEYIVDGDESTLAWMAGTGNGNILANQGVRIDFSRDVVLKDISILQGSGDRVSSLKIQYLKGDQWEDLTTVQNAGANVKVEGNSVTTKAIRLINAAGNTGLWWQLYEVKVTEVAAAGIENIYTNVDAHEFNAAVDETQASLSAGSLTLQPQQYMGIDFKEIKKIGSVDQAFSGEGIVLEYSNNGKVWKAISEVSGDTARYVRFVNKSQQATDLKVDKLAVTLLPITEMGELVSSDVPINASWGDTRENGQAFDNNMNTQTKFGGSARKGNTIVYSFGQEITVESLRIYTSDGTQDYVRDALVQLSTDGKEWTDAFEIGDGVADTAEQANQTMGDVGAGEADSNYPNVRYYGRDDLNTKARYMRLLITADYPNRSLIMNEIVINGGAYISSESNMAFSGTVEERGYEPSKMIDSDFTTAYRPSAENGSMTYQISDGSDIRSVRVIQNGDASGAVVKAELYNEANGQTETVTMGSLTQALNEFKVKDGYTLLSIEFSWKDKLPEIAEILLLSNEVGNADKSELNDILNAKPAGYENWTNTSKNAYDALETLAKDLQDDEAVSQLTVDNMVASLRKAAEEAETKVNAETVSKMQDLVDNKTANDNTYTTASYQAYENSLNQLEAALKNTDDLSQKKAEQLVEKAESALAALTYSIRNRELAELELRSYDGFVADNYTTASYQALTAARQRLETQIAADKAAQQPEDRVNPSVFAELTNAYLEAVDGLVDTTALKAEIAQEVDETLYTSESYQQYAEAVEEGKQLLVDGTKEAVAEAVNKIQTARKQLVLVSDAALQDLIKEIEALNENSYTIDSYQALMVLVEEAKQPGADSAEYVKRLDEAMKALVNVDALKEKMAEAKRVDEDLYTVSSYRTLRELMAKEEELLKSGTTETINEMIASLDEAIRSLEIRAQGVEDYLDSIVLKPQGSYTDESYQAYKDAYDALMNADPADLSVREFLELQNAFEKAELGLTIKDSEIADEDKDDAGDTPTGVAAAPISAAAGMLALSAAALFVLQRKKKEQ